VRYPIITALSLGTLLLACAHDAKNQHANNEANALETPAEARAEQRAENDEKRVAGDEKRVAEDVQVPAPRDKKRMANADGTLPQDRQPADERAGDRDNLNALDQGNGEIDLDLTQRIRKAVMADDSLSFSAKNAKIITREGHVTLRGTVKTGAEKDAIYKSAVNVAGAGHVSNELEIDDD
jgi:hyperosmotically inducible protein